MMRKRIGVITACPENDYQHRVLTGILAQANAYNYDVFVFSPLAHVTSNSREHVKGELNIFNLINFELLDACIVMPIPLTENNDTSIADRLLEKFKESCHIPVVSIDIPAIKRSKLSKYISFYEKQDAEHIAQAIIKTDIHNNNIDLIRSLESKFKKDIERLINK